MSDREIRSWTGLVAPIVAKCEVGAAFEGDVVFTPDGARALGELMREMGEKLDYACDHPILAAAGRVAEIAKQRLGLGGVL